MNISTYEARIKALEDQLNPPGPAQETGLISITLSPDIQLDNDDTFNNELSLLMPLTTEGITPISKIVSTPMEQTYNITVVPGASWYGLVADTIGEEPGQPVTGQVNLGYEQNQEHLAFNAGAVSDTTDQSAPFSILNVDILGVIREG